jgi:hypothetical protein
MNQINVTNPVVYRLDFKNYMLSFDVTTETNSTTLIDLSKSSLNETKIISSSNIYYKFKDVLLSRTNKNIGAIKFYSYAGGKEITRLINGSNQMSKLEYPPFNGTLFSSIILPEMNNNDSVYILIDSYNEITSILCPLMKKELINRDLNIMLNNIKTNVADKNVNVTILFETKLYDDFIKYEPELKELINSFNIKLEDSKGNLVFYTSDLVLDHTESKEI